MVHESLSGVCGPQYTNVCVKSLPVIFKCSVPQNIVGSTVCIFQNIQVFRGNGCNLKKLDESMCLYFWFLVWPSYLQLGTTLLWERVGISRWTLAGAAPDKAPSLLAVHFPFYLSASLSAFSFLDFILNTLLYFLCTLYSFWR